MTAIEDREAPDTTQINGRAAEEWERPRILSAKMRERERAAELVAGVRPYASSPDAMAQEILNREPPPGKRPRRAGRSFAANMGP